MEIWACRLLHGSYSWLLTGAANTLTVGSSDPLEHWWLRIQTNCAYYTIQKWKNGVINMYRTTSAYGANQTGLCCADKEEDADRWREKSCSIIRLHFQVCQFLQ